MTGAVLEAGGRRPRLADRLVADLGERIRSGQLSPGSRLPTETELGETFGVSRTVVREAVARLSADGLVEARQGAGMFVSGNPATEAIRQLASDDLGDTVAMVLNVLEVRMAVEMEAAALAATRRSLSQAGDIQRAFGEFDALLRTAQPTGTADFAFHRSIARATNNPFYVEILDVLGRRTIPRDLVPMIDAGLLHSREYQAGLHEEHRAIMSAILDGDPAAARVAMNAHLSASQTRYQRLLRQGGDLGEIFSARLG